MNEAIEQQIKVIEQNHQVTILYACESGSRAWGFASPDSDYDVLFKGIFILENIFHTRKIGTHH